MKFPDKVYGTVDKKGPYYSFGEEMPDLLYLNGDEIAIYRLESIHKVEVKITLGDKEWHKD